MKMYSVEVEATETGLIQINQFLDNELHSILLGPEQARLISEFLTAIADDILRSE